MGNGGAAPRTVANGKWQKKAGYISKSYKLKKIHTDAFANACEKAGRSQASVITELMEGFIKRQEESDSKG